MRNGAGRFAVWRGFILAAFIALAAMPAQAASVTIINDGDFDPADWTVTPVGTADLSQITVTRETTGGNPEFYRKTISAPRTQYFDFLYLANGAVYNPSTQGPLASVDWSVDVLSISNSVKGWAAIYELVAVQGGVVFSGDGAQASEPGWFEWPTETRIRQDDFVNFGSTGPEHPDFSRNGGPIQFGYVFSANQRGGVSGIDNLVVKLNTTGGAQGPNLFGEWHDDFSVDCRPIRGGKMECTINALIVSNDGSKNAGGKKKNQKIRATYYLSNDGVLDGADIQVGTSTLGIIKAGQTKNFVLKFNLPAGVNLEKASGKFLIAKIDSTNKASETDETDNLAVIQIP